MVRHNEVDYGFGGELTEGSGIDLMEAGSSWTEKLYWGNQAGS